jgi:hypothetical protein
MDIADDFLVLIMLELRDANDHHQNITLGLFSWGNFLGSATVSFFVLFSNLCPIMD